METEMTEMNREVIVDLLPAYFSDEASEETRRLVEGYFEQDPEFARMARRMNDKLLQSVPVQLPENHQMKTLRRVQMKLTWQVVALALVLASAVTMTLIVMAFVLTR